MRPPRRVRDRSAWRGDADQPSLTSRTARRRRAGRGSVRAADARRGAAQPVTGTAPSGILAEACGVQAAFVGAMSIAQMLVAASGAGAAPQRNLIERPVASEVPGSGLVKEPFVRVRAPPPDSVGPTPPAATGSPTCGFAAVVVPGNRSVPTRSSCRCRLPRRRQLLRPARSQRGAERDPAGQGPGVLGAGQACQLPEDLARHRRGRPRAGPEGRLRLLLGDRRVNGKAFGGFKTPRQADFLSEFGLSGPCATGIA